MLQIAFTSIASGLISHRYVDITEAIESADPSYVDNSQFEEADAVPLSGPLPTTHYVQDEVYYKSFPLFLLLMYAL